jgi:cellobiose-specific phosphotransferase system component IIB
MNPRGSHYAPVGVSVATAMIPIVCVLALSSGLLAAQVTISAGPLPLSEVKTIYIAPPSDDFVHLLKSRLEKWGALNITSQVEEADAILTCQTKSRIVPAKVVVRQTEAQVRLVDLRQHPDGLAIRTGRRSTRTSL